MNNEIITHFTELLQTFFTKKVAHENLVSTTEAWAEAAQQEFDAIQQRMHSFQQTISTHSLSALDSHPNIKCVKMVLEQ